MALRTDAGAHYRLVLLVARVGVRQPGGYAYCAAFALLGTLVCGAGTIWYARRRGYWPSGISASLFARLLGRRNPLTQVELPAVVIVPRRRR
jgi:hypothetical protein